MLHGITNCRIVCLIGYNILPIANMNSTFYLYLDNWLTI